MENGIVKAVHDGDSYKVQFKDETIWIRLYGCDSPEVISNYVTKDQPFGRTAGNIVRDLIKGKELTFERMYKDQYNRQVCKVYIDGQDLTKRLVELGLAWWLDDSKMNSLYLSELKLLHETAKGLKIGLWGETARKLRPSTWRNNNRRFVLNEEKEFPDLW